VEREMKNKFKLFTPGPVQQADDILELGSHQVRYFRNRDFADKMLGIEKMLLEILMAESGSRLITLTASGTAAMEASIINCFSANEKMLIINGGSFGARFSEICKYYNQSYEEHILEPGGALNIEDLSILDLKSFSCLLVNHHETSTGSLYNLDEIARLCKENNLFLIVDAIGSFLADPIDLSSKEIDILILSSHKGLALPPGLSFLVLSERAINKVQQTEGRSYYLDLRRALANGSRGQTPWTPALQIIDQLDLRIANIHKEGIDTTINHVKHLAEDFRAKINSMPFKIFPENSSNAITALEPLNTRYSPDDFVNRLLVERDIYVCPNGGELGKRIFRVGHLGDLTIDDNEFLIQSIKHILKG
jgi:aspartate aminotransferase-like enzyme